MLLAGGLVLGAVIASVLLSDPGRVTISLQGYVIDMTLPVAVLLLLTLYVVVRAIAHVIGNKRRAAAERAVRQRERSLQQLEHGLIAMSEGDWAEAEQVLTRSAFASPTPLLHYLAAARAAELQGAVARRDEWLTKALDVAPTERVAVYITQAEMFLKHNQLQAALTTLEQLDATSEQNARGLALLARIHRQQGDWQKLKALEPRLRSTTGIPAALIDDLLAQVHLDMLKAAGTAKDATQLEQAWKEVPKTLASRPDVLVSYARAAMACGEVATAEESLRDLLNRQWDDAAVLVYGDVELPEPLRTLQTVEKWLNTRPQDPTLLYVCAQCCIRNELYGKARSYLEASLGIRPRLETYQMLAKLLEASGEREQAFNLLNDALVQAVGRKTLLPRLRALRTVERRHGGERRTLR